MTDSTRRARRARTGPDSPPQGPQGPDGPGQSATVVDLATRRRDRIGGSDAAAACGVDPYRSRIMLWAEKTGRVEREQNEAMAWGTLLEPVVYGELERRGWEVMPAPADEGVHPDHPWLTGHVDGYVNVDGERGVLEIKTGSQWTARQWQEAIHAPISYVIQCHHYMELTGLDVCLLACLVGGQRLETRIVRRDYEVNEAMLLLEADFLNYLRADEPPPPDGSASAQDALRALYPHGTDAAVRLTGDDWKALKELRARREQRDEIDRQVKELTQRIQAVMGDATEAFSPFDELAVTWRNVEQRRFDTTAFHKDHPALWDEYAVPKPTRRFEVK